MKKELFWMEKEADRFTTIHFSDGTSISFETESLAIKMAFEILKTRGTVGY
jgi:hypothetical protein